MPTVKKEEIYEGGLAAEGWHLIRVSNCERKTSQKGDAMYSIALERPTGEFIGYDNIMLEGKGNGMGFQKLYALGGAEDLGDSVRYDDPDELVGRQAYVYIRHGEYQGKTKCEVDIQMGSCGYLPENKPPRDMASSGSAPADLDDDPIPF